VPDDGAGLLTIGEFARRSRLSMRALRLYDRIALLRPAEVVPETGHRRYAGRQLYAARLIALLRRLDMPLTQIAEIVHAAGPDAARLLAQYWTDVERRLAAQRDLADRLVGSLASETPAPPGTWRVAERDVPEQVVLTEQRYVTAAQLTWIRDATARLTAVADRCGGPAGPRPGRGVCPDLAWHGRSGRGAVTPGAGAPAGVRPGGEGPLRAAADPVGLRYGASLDPIPRPARGRAAPRGIPLRRRP
jgi:DNA-binding transcriptional MerR regulator